MSHEEQIKEVLSRSSDEELQRILNFHRMHVNLVALEIEKRNEKVSHVGKSY